MKNTVRILYATGRAARGLRLSECLGSCKGLVVRSFLVAMVIMPWCERAQAVPISIVLADGGILIDPTVTVDATSTSSVGTGPYIRAGETLFTNDTQLANAKAHAAQYDGPTQLIADYTIVLKPDKSVDPTKSTITFESVNWTYKGTLVTEKAPRFKTVAVPIVQVVLNPDDSVASFRFEGVDWYPPTANGAAGLNSRLLNGEFDLVSGNTVHLASYSSKSTGAIYDYDVVGKIQVVPKPIEDEPVFCADLGGCVSFLAPPFDAPEPSTLVLVLIGMAGIRTLASYRVARKEST